VGRRDAGAEASGPLQRRAAEFPGIVERRSLFGNSGIKTGYGGDWFADHRVARRDGMLDREQGLKILAREALNIAVSKAPTSQANWLWDCTTPDAALAGTSVSAGAIRFACKTTGSRTFCLQIASAYRIDFALQGHGFQPCRQSLRGSWPSTEVIGTPLQNTMRADGTLACLCET